MRMLAVAALFAAMSPAAWAWDDTRRISAPQPSCAAGVSCEVRVTPGFMAGQVTLDFSGRAPALAASGVILRVYNPSGAVIIEKSAGLMSDGRLSLLIANGQTMEPGRYRYVIDGIAEGRFEVLTGAAEPSAPARVQPPAQSAGKAAPSRVAPRKEASSGAVAPQAAALAGVWYGIAGTPGSLELTRDGSYMLNGKPGGRYRQLGDEVVFDGSLVAWNKGRAKLKDGVLEFYWKNAEGFNNWFVFQKGE